MSATLHERRFAIAIAAIIIVPLSGFGIDIYVPSLPAVSTYFHINHALAQLSITTYMLGYGLTQFFSGTIIDSVGRKPSFIISMIIYIVASLLIPHVHTIEQLLILRLAQGCCVAFFQVAMRSVIPDLFTGHEFHKMTTYIIMAWSIGPIIAPAIGGYLAHYFSWKANFYFLAAYGVITIILNVLFIPETLANKKAFSLRALANDYKLMLTHRAYLSSVASLGLLYSIMILFSVIAPFLVQNVLHYSAVEFGHMALLMGLAWFLGSLSNRFLIQVDSSKKIKFNLSVMTAISIVMISITMITDVNIYNLIVPSFFLLYLGGMLFPVYAARCTSLFPYSVATANALMGVFMVIIPSINSALSTLLRADTEIPLAFAYLVIIMVCWGVYCLNRK